MTFQWPWPTPEPGIYFNMSFEQYLALPCMNAGGIKNLLISPTDYWAMSKMNPLCDEIDEDSKAKLDGRAYHCRILEGRDEFYRRYMPDFEYAGDPNGLIRTGDDISAALKSIGVPSSFKTKLEGAARLLQYRPDARILSVLENEWRHRFAGREFLDPKTVRQIELASAMIERHPHIQRCFAGGYPEVTVIFVRKGLTYKVRYDYLKLQAISDLKTFANQMRKGIDRAINQAFAGMKYHIPGTLYLLGATAAQEHVRAGRVFGAEEAGIDPEWLADFAAADPIHEFWFVFQQKGVAPVARWKIFSDQDKGFSQGEAIIDEARDLFIKYFEKYGEDCWIDLQGPSYFHYDEMPSFINEV